MKIVNPLYLASKIIVLFYIIKKNEGDLILRNGKIKNQEKVNQTYHDFLS